MRSTASAAAVPSGRPDRAGVARALIVGCGCRGRLLGARLNEAEWQVRGTSRSEDRLAVIADAGIEPALADPDRPGTVLELVADVAVVYWLLGSAVADVDQPEQIGSIHGPRLERLLEKLVDTPVRGFVYEAAGDVSRDHIERGVEVVETAAARWRIPVEIVTEAPGAAELWAAEMADAGIRLLSRQRPG
jgi:hypothetical protein